MRTKEVSVGVAIYSDEFKDGAVKQVLEGGYPVAEVANRLGVSSKSIYTWLRERGGRSRASKNAETVDNLKSEVAQLKAELKRTKEERDILKKAAAYFAKASE
jgi:transposase